MEAIGKHKLEFYKKLDAMIDEKQNVKLVISDSLYDEIIQSIKAGRNQDSQLKYWAKDEFRLNSKENIEYLETIGGKMIPRYSQLFEIINALHQTAGHGDKEKTCKQVYKKCGFIKREVIQIFMEKCPTCGRELMTKEISKLQDTYTPKCTTLVQFSILDMASKGDRSYKYMMHARDSYSQFSWSEPLLSDSVKDVGTSLSDICSRLKAPLMLQGDSEEFTFKVIQFVQVYFSPYLFLHIMVGRSRDPGSPSFLEEPNSDLMNRLEGWMSQHKDQRWSDGLFETIYRMNGTINPLHGKTPFQVMHPDRRAIDFSDMWLLANIAAQQLCSRYDSASNPDATAEEAKTNCIISSPDSTSCDDKSQSENMQLRIHQD